MLVYENRASKMKFFGVKDFCSINFDFRNGCKNELKDNNEKSYRRFKNRVPLKIYFRANWTHESIPTAWELNTGSIFAFTLCLHKILEYF